MNILNAKVELILMASLVLILVLTVTCHAGDERQSLEELRNTGINLLQTPVDQGVITKEKTNKW